MTALNLEDVERDGRAGDAQKLTQRSRAVTLELEIVERQGSAGLVGYELEMGV